MASSAKCNLGNWIAREQRIGDVHFRSRSRAGAARFSLVSFDALESLFLFCAAASVFCWDGSSATRASEKERCVFMCYSGLSKAAARRCRRITQKTANKDKAVDGVSENVLGDWSVCVVPKRTRGTHSNPRCSLCLSRPDISICHLEGLPGPTPHRLRDKTARGTWYKAANKSQCNWPL